MFSHRLLMLFALSLLGLTGGLEESDSPKVQLPEGIIKGKYLTSRNERRYEAYMGIRYGYVAERFGISVPISGNWDGIKEATEFGPLCIQPSPTSKEPQGSEDCLFLNIYTPKGDKNRKYAVLFYIHGGGFTLGTGSSFGGKYLVDEDIVVVTLNYRLGILGFLNTKDKNAFGNMGLKDQLLALKWVHENIEHFGGDKTKVTISGASAGGASTIYLILSPQAKGLFHNAIAFSGTALNLWAFAEESSREARKVGIYLNCPIASTTRKFVDCLKKKSVTELISAQSSLTEWFMDPMILFPPTLEKRHSSNPDPFLEFSPTDLIGGGDFHRTPLLLTLNKDEGVVVYSGVVLRTEPMRKELDEDFRKIAPITFVYRNDQILSSNLDHVTQQIRHFYFEDKEINFPTAENLTNAYTDTWFLYGIHKTAIKLGKSIPVYTGLFTHESKHFSLTHVFGIKEILGVGHGDEASYIFDPAVENSQFQVVYELKNSDDINFSKKISKVIANFVKTSIPNSGEKNFQKWNPVSIDEIDSNSLDWFNLGDIEYSHKNPFRNRINFWDTLYKESEKKDEL